MCVKKTQINKFENINKTTLCECVSYVIHWSSKDIVPCQFFQGFDFLRIIRSPNYSLHQVGA